ncbi:MAG: substrate-binding domain-containing protein [Brevefilum sp.]
MAKITRLFLLGIILIVSASACSGEQSTPQATTQLEIINLQTTPALEHWLEDVAGCAADIPDFAVTTQILPLSELDLEQANLILRLGERQEDDPYVSVMGVENLVVLAGSEVPVDSLSQNVVQRIFTGEITNWSEVPEVQNAGIEINQPILTLSYPEGHELRLLFQKAYLEDETLGDEPQIFSTETYLEELLVTHAYALGYTLESLKATNVQTLAIRGFDEALAQQPVLAVTADEPSGELRQLLLCLQN